MLGRHVNHFFMCITALLTEYARARAKASRWLEERVLLCEEMRRVLAFCEYELARWSKLAEHVDGRSVGDLILHGKPAALAHSSPELQRARRAFAHEQADRESRLRAALTRLWRPALCAAREVGTEGVHVPPEDDLGDDSVGCLDDEAVYELYDG
jgi:hypothetical protein